ncbi:MAG: putative mobile endonuclease B [Prokaryotic dsDNA virus sp.]|nr:MAG: putative mobile endonuclease B [Prokaryotic dsDNA virus sp.]
MDYVKIYEVFMASRKERGWGKTHPQFLERHHIKPKSAGGDNSKSNLVFLTPREHFVAHKLLYKISPTKENAYALVALTRMSAREGIIRCNSLEIEKGRVLASKLSSERMSGDNNPGSGKFGKEHHLFTGVWVTPSGRFETLDEAASVTGIGRSSVQRRCKNPDYVNNAPRLGLENMGKSWRELGYWFEECEINECF